MSVTKACSIAVSKTKTAFQANKKRAEERLKLGKITAEGEVLERTIEVADEALKIIEKGNFGELAELDRGNLVSNMASVLLRRALTDTFEGGIAADASSSTPRQDLVFKGAEYDLKNETVVVTVTPRGQNKYWKYKFTRGTNTSEVSESNNKTKLFISGFVNTFNQTVEDILNTTIGLSQEREASAANTAFAYLHQVYGSASINELLESATDEKSKKFNYKRASKRKNYVHGSREDMKKLLADLHALTTGTTNEIYAYYNELLDKMHPHFFRNMNVFINENAKHTFGWVDLEKNHILLDTSSKHLEGMSNEEVYMHETVHTMTAWALQQKGFYPSRLKNRLNYLHRLAYKKLTWKDLVKANPHMSEKQAKARFDYIFTDDNAQEEFIAYALTNPYFMKLLGGIEVKDKRKPGLLNAIKDFFGDLLNAVMGNYSFKERNSTVQKEIHTLAFRLAEINNTAETAIKSSPIVLLNELVDRIEGNFEEWASSLTDKLDKGAKVVIPPTMNRMQKILFLGRFFAKGVYNKNYRHAVGFYLTSVGIKPTSSIREIGRSLLPRLDESTIKGEMAHLQTNQIDAARNTHTAVVAKNITEAFSRPLTDEEENALTTVFLESNASTLFKKDKNLGKGYSKAQLYKLLTDVGFRKKNNRTSTGPN